MSPALWKINLALAVMFYAMAPASLSWAGVTMTPDQKAAYLKHTSQLLSDSIREMADHNLNIIPTPKQLKVHPGRLVLTADGAAQCQIVIPASDAKYLLAAQKINEKVRELGGADLPVIRWDAGGKNPSGNLIVIGSPSAGGVLAEYCGRHDVNLTADNPGVQGYVIRCLAETGRQVYLCGGSDADGALYAAITFGHLLLAEDGKITALIAEIRDWPDFKWRKIGGAPMYPKKIDDGKQAVDWLLRCKVNMTWGNLQAGQKPHFAGMTPARRQYYKAVADYAFARGIYFDVIFFTNIGWMDLDKDNPDYKHCLIGVPRGYFCWSMDEYIRKRAREIAEFASQTGIRSFTFHEIDAGGDVNPARWNDRCEQCRKRFGEEAVFGEDKAHASAHVLQIFYDELKDADQDIKLHYIVYPYGASHYANSAPSRVFMRKLLELIPADVPVCLREGRREDMDGARGVLQNHPVYLYDIPMFASGLLCANIRFVKTFYYGNDQDVYFCSEIGPVAAVSEMLAAEFAWNTAAPGSSYFGDKKYFYDNKNPPAAIFEFAQRACQSLFGKAAAPYLYPAFLNDFKPMFIRDYDLIKKLVVSSYQTAEASEFTPDKIIAQKECAETILQNIAAMRQKGVVPQRPALVAEIYDLALSVRYQAEVRCHLVQAEDAVLQGRQDEAKRLLDAGMDVTRRHLADTEVPASVKGELRGLEDKIKKAMLKLAVTGTAAQGVNSGRGAAAQKPQGGGIIQVVVYNATPGGGKSYGVKGLMDTLSDVRMLNTREITDLSEASMQDAEVLVFPSTPSLADAQAVSAVEVIRDFVARQGHGALLMHNSVGGERSGVGFSIFPTGADAAGRVEDRLMKIARPHFITGYAPAGFAAEAMFFDHVALKAGVDGEILLKNKFDQPVVIAADIGDGRVVFDGQYPGKDRDTHLDGIKMTGLDRIILLNSVLWLARHDDLIKLEIRNAEKIDETMSDGGVSAIYFELAVPAGQPELTNVVITGEVYDLDDLASRKAAPVLALPSVKGPWFSPERLRLSTKTPCQKACLVIKLECNQGMAYALKSFAP